MTFSYLSNTEKKGISFSAFQAFTVILLIAAFSSTAAADSATQITQCGTIISQPGHYILANDLSCGFGPVAPVTGSPEPPSADGIDIVADHVDLMLNGHTISGGGIGNGIGVGIGIAAGNSHVNILGPGTITGFNAGVTFEQVSHSSVKDVTSTGNFFGFVVNGGFAAGCDQGCPSIKNTFQGNVATFNDQHGFTLNGANDNTFRDNDAENNANGNGILLFVAAGNDVRGNTTSVNGGSGIAVSADTGTDNDIRANRAQNNGFFDLQDDNPNCDNNRWKSNTFGTASQACIQ